MPTERVVLFVDHQNIYKGARDAFFEGRPPHFTSGQFNPISMGRLICSRPPPDIARQLGQVRIYTGQPDSTRQSKSYGASRKQYALWRRRGVEVISRPLRYPPTFPNDPPQEKGVDVALAIDFIRLAIEGAYDAGVIASTDTDLVPALDFVIQHDKGTPKAEVAAWAGQGRRPRVSSTMRPIWCHWLDQADYDAIHDPTDYTR